MLENSVLCYLAKTVSIVVFIPRFRGAETESEARFFVEIVEIVTLLCLKFGSQQKPTRSLSSDPRRFSDPNKSGGEPCNSLPFVKGEGSVQPDPSFVKQNQHPMKLLRFISFIYVFFSTRSDAMRSDQHSKAGPWNGGRCCVGTKPGRFVGRLWEWKWIKNELQMFGKLSLIHPYT